MSFYDDMAALALDLLTEFGQPLTLTRKAPGGYDYDTGTASTVDTPYAGVGAAFDYKLNEIDGSKVLQGDRRVYVAPQLATAPQPGDRLTLVTGEVLVVIESRPLAPAGQTVLHDVQVRGV